MPTIDFNSETIDFDKLCRLTIGLDDVDTLSGGCTTHAATYLLQFLDKNLGHFYLIDFPNLVRLNPAIPWKTRGNGAIAIHMLIPCSLIDKAVEFVESFLGRYLEHIQGVDQDPGLIIVSGDIPTVFKEIYLRALTDIVVPEILLNKVSRYKNVYVSTQFRGRGIVGAAAAIGWILTPSDYTYELLTYRSTSHWYKTVRCIDIESVKVFDALTRGMTFNNFDYDTHTALIAPHGLDPVLYGVRGEEPNILLKAFEIIRVCEPIAAWSIFRTNQGTDAHAVPRKVKDMKPYRTGSLRLTVISLPKVLTGGHVLLRGSDSSGSITLAFFKPSTLNTVALKLGIGDVIEVQGYAKPWGCEVVFHVEKLRILKSLPREKDTAPLCPFCGSRIKKLGRGKGYRCTQCKRVVYLAHREPLYVPSNLHTGLYLPPPRVQKHLTKPLCRYGKEKKEHPKTHILLLSQVLKVNEPLQFL